MRYLESLLATEMDDLLEHWMVHWIVVLVYQLVNLLDCYLDYYLVHLLVCQMDVTLVIELDRLVMMKELYLV